MADIQIQTGAAVKYGWESVKKDLWYFVGLALVSVIIGSVGSSDQENNFWDFIAFFLSTWMTCGTITIALHYQRGQKLPFSALFTSTKQYLKVLGATILYGVVVFAGFLLLIVPGIYWALRYQFMITLIIDKDLKIMDAFHRSAEMTKGRTMSLLMFDLTMIGVIILGLICLGVGILVAAPVVWLALVVVYRQFSDQSVEAKTSA